MQGKTKPFALVEPSSVAQAHLKLLNKFSLSRFARSQTTILICPNKPLPKRFIRSDGQPAVDENGFLPVFKSVKHKKSEIDSSDLVLSGDWFNSNPDKSPHMLAKSFSHEISRGTHSRSGIAMIVPQREVPVLASRNSMLFLVSKERIEVMELVRDAMRKKRHWKELSDGSYGTMVWNLLWTWRRATIDYSQLLFFQKVNHFPNSFQLTRKDSLKDHIEAFSRKNGLIWSASFKVMPESFLLPLEWTRFSEAFRRDEEELGERNFWIIKPVGSSRGRGIFITNDLKKLSEKKSKLDNSVVQKYIPDPLLIGGYKFDFRLYVLVTSFCPLEAFLYTQGFARLSTVQFSMDPKTVTNRMMHLTNYAVQKENASHVDLDMGDRLRGGSKLSIKRLWEILEDRGIDSKAVWERIKEVVIKTLMVVDEPIGHQANSFEVFGFDILLDESLRPWLLEVNSSPSMARETELDRKVKLEMMVDTIDLVDPIGFDRGYLKSILQKRVEVGDWDSTPEAINEHLTKLLRGKIPRMWGEKPHKMGAYCSLVPSEAYDRINRQKLIR